MELQNLRPSALCHFRPHFSVGRSAGILAGVSVSFAILLCVLVTLVGRPTSGVSVQSNRPLVTNRPGSVTGLPEPTPDHDCITGRSSPSDRGRADRLNTPDYAFRIAIKAFGDVKAASGTTRFVVPAIAAVVLNVAPTQPTDLKVGLYVKWPGYGFRLADIAANT